MSGTFDEKCIKSRTQLWTKKMLLKREPLNFPPINDRVCEGSRATSIWLNAYLNFRMDDDTTRQQAKDYLDQLGQNSSLFASRFRGSLLGLALGDASGSTPDFRTRNSQLITATDGTGGGPSRLSIEAWTGRTSMTICLAHSLIREEWFNWNDQMNLYMQWWKYNAFSANKKTSDMSDAVTKALKHYESTGNLDTGDPSPSATGSESLMRLAPVVLFCFGNIKDCISYSGSSSVVTHKSAKAVASCKYMGALLFGAIRGYPKEKLTKGLFEPYPGVWDEYTLETEVINVAKTAHLKTHNEITSSGYIIDTLEAAIWVFHNTSSFEDGMILAVNLPGSNKSAVTSVYGQLAGAFYGEHNINPDWIKSIPLYHVFYYYAERLLRYGVSDAPMLFLGENSNFMP